MTIQTVTSVGSTASTVTAGIGTVQHQITSLQRQIAAERCSSDDGETKEKKMQAIQLQIEQLQSQLQLLQAKAKEQAEKKATGALTGKAA